MAGARRLAMGFVALAFVSLHAAALAEDELQLQASMTPCELIRYFGYPCEVSYVVTDDGYLLEVDRIRHGRSSCNTCDPGRQPRYPVLLLPALMASSDMWFLNYPSQSAGFLLADGGFDVWAMNSRESAKYSSHVNLSKEDGKYWKWSFDEMGRYDLAAGIDHVLSATGASKLTLFALSQGVTIALVLLSTRPEYNQKVELIVGYAPIGNITNMGHPIPLLLEILRHFAVDIDPENNGGYSNLNAVAAGGGGILPNCVCSWIMTSCLLTSAHQLNKTRIPLYFGRYPTGTSFQNWRHYHQMYHTKDMVMYDHGTKENFVRYSQAAPPSYALERIRTALAFFSSHEDVFATPKDVSDLISRMKDRIVLHYVVPPPGMYHFDFASGYKAAASLHKLAIDTIRKHTRACCAHE